MSLASIYTELHRQLARSEHPGQPLRDEVTAARAEIAYLREWLRDDLKISNADIDEALAKADHK